MKKTWIYMAMALLLILALFYISTGGKTEIKNFFKEGFLGGEREFYLESSRELKEGEKLFSFKDNLVSWHNGELTIFGEEEKSLSLNIEEPIFELGEDLIYVGNPVEGIIYFVNLEGEIVERIDLGSPLFNMKSKGKLLLYHRKYDNMESIGIVNNEGQNIMKYDFRDEKILNCDYDTSDKIAYIGTLKSDENIGSKLYIYKDLKEPEVIEFSNEIILNVDVVKLGNYLVLTDEKLYYFSGKEVVWEEEIVLLKDYKVYDDNPYLLISNTLSKLNLKGEVEEELKFAKSYNKFLRYDKGVLNEEILVYGPEGLAIWDKEEIASKDLEIQDVFINGESIFVIREGIVEEYTLEVMEGREEDEGAKELTR